MDISDWKDIEIGTVFPNIIKPEVYHTRQVQEDDDGIPYIVRSKFNNGIKYRVKRPEGAINPKGVISFGAENSNFFYQKEEWVSGRDIYYIDTRGIPEFACYFIITCLRKLTSYYSYNFGLFPELLKMEHIKLPYNEKNEPDYASMEQYMLKVLNEVSDSISAISKVKTPKAEAIDTTEWKEFSIEKLFVQKKPDARSQLNYDDGDVPFVGSGNYNNAILRYVKPHEGEQLDKGNCITVSPVDGASFYQEHDFLGRGGGGSSIILLYNDNLNPLNGYFIATIIRKICGRYFYGDMGNAETIGKEKIPLPTDKDGNPDYKYMEEFMEKHKLKYKGHVNQIKNLI